MVVCLSGYCTHRNSSGRGVSMNCPQCGKEMTGVLTDEREGVPFFGSINIVPFCYNCNSKPRSEGEK